MVSYKSMAVSLTTLVGRVNLDGVKGCRFKDHRGRRLGLLRCRGLKNKRPSRRKILKIIPGGRRARALLEHWGNTFAHLPTLAGAA